MKKNVIVIISAAFFVVLILSSLIVYANSQKEEPILQEKVYQEILYLNNYMVSLLGFFNGITTEDDILKENQPQIESEINTDFSEETKQENTDDSKNKGDKEKAQSSSKQNTILSLDGKYTPNWEQIQMQTEKLYQIWNTIAVDLHALNVNGESILAFSNNLNNATKNIKDKKKEAAMNELIKNYELLLEYQKSCEGDSQKSNLLQIQVKVSSGYVNVTNEKWDEAKRDVKEAEQIFSNVLNTVSNNYENQTTMNQCYILVNELRSAVNLKDKEIFFIEYKNFINKIQSLMG